MSLFKFEMTEILEKSPALQQDFILFEEKKSAYIKLQDEISEARECELEPLRNAEAIERKASAAEVALKNSIRNLNIEQGAVSDEMARIETMKNEAKELRFTAHSRAGKAESLSIQLAALRPPLEGIQRRINSAANKSLLYQALNQPGVRDSLMSAFALSRAITVAELEDSAAILLGHCINSEHREQEINRRVRVDFANEVINIFGGVNNVKAPQQLATLPARAAGEKNMSPAQLHKTRIAKLRQEGSSY